MPNEDEQVSWSDDDAKSELSYFDEPAPDTQSADAPPAPDTQDAATPAPDTQDVEMAPAPNTRGDETAPNTPETEPPTSHAHSMENMTLTSFGRVAAVNPEEMEPASSPPSKRKPATKGSDTPTPESKRARRGASRSASSAALPVTTTPPSDSVLLQILATMQNLEARMDSLSREHSDQAAQFNRRVGQLETAGGSTQTAPVTDAQVPAQSAPNAPSPQQQAPPRQVNDSPYSIHRQREMLRRRQQAPPSPPSAPASSRAAGFSSTNTASPSRGAVASRAGDARSRSRTPLPPQTEVVSSGVNRPFSRSNYRPTPWPSSVSSSEVPDRGSQTGPPRFARLSYPPEQLDRTTTSTPLPSAPRASDRPAAEPTSGRSSRPSSAPSAAPSKPSLLERMGPAPARAPLPPVVGVQTVLDDDHPCVVFVAHHSGWRTSDTGNIMVLFQLWESYRRGGVGPLPPNSGVETSRIVNRPTVLRLQFKVQEEASQTMAFWNSGYDDTDDGRPTGLGTGVGGSTASSPSGALFSRDVAGYPSGLVLDSVMPSPHLACTSSTGEMRRLVVWSWNVDGKLLPNLSRLDFRNMVQGSDVFFIQETQLRPDQRDMVRGIPGYDVFVISRTMYKDEKTWGGVAAFVKKDLRARLVEDWSSTDLMVLLIGDMYFVNAYVAPPTSEYDKYQAVPPWTMFRNLVREMHESGVKYSVYGDINVRIGPHAPSFNGHPPRVADDLITNERMNKLFDMCNEHQILIANGSYGLAGKHSGYTYYQHKDTSVLSGRSTLDYHDMGDHSPLRAHVLVDVKRSPPPPRPDTLLRADLNVPNETDLNAEFLGIWSKIMSEKQLLEHTYGCKLSTLGPRVQVYVDGSCKNQGKVNARAGAGVFWGPNSKDASAKNLSFKVRVPGEQTNNRAELFAVLAVLSTAPEDMNLDIRSDSEHAIDMIAHLGPVLAQTGWDCTNGDVLLAIQHRMRQRTGSVVLHKVKAHVGNEWNDGADELARQGADIRNPSARELAWLNVPSPLPAPIRPDEVAPSLGARIPRCLSICVRLADFVSRVPKGVARSGPEFGVKNAKPAVQGTHLGKPAKRGSRGWFLGRIREAGKDSSELWKIANAIRRPPSAAPPPVDLDDLTDDYIVRLNPPPDPAAVGFDPLHLADIVAHAASIPERSQEAVYPVLNVLLTVHDMEGVKALLRKRGRNSVPGIDRLTYAALMSVDNEVLCDLLNDCLRNCDAPGSFYETLISSVPKPGKDPSKPSGYRGIGLQSCVYKLLSMAYNFRLNSVLESNDLLPPSQNGFRANNYTNNNPFILRTLIDKARADGETLYVAFVDISNAFLSMSHELLWLRMQELGLTGPFYDFIRKIYREMKLRVACGEAVSEEWKSVCGVLMGDPVSPTLWNIFLSSFTLAEDPDNFSLMGYTLSHLEHADDMALVSRSWQGLQRQLDQLGTWCKRNLLQVNALKSAAMIFGPISPRPSRRPDRCVTLCGESVPWLAQHKYVGIWFDSTCRDIFRAHYEHKHNAAAYVYWKTILGCDLYVGHGRLPPDVACQLYYASVDPHLTHGCDVMLDVDPVSFAWLDSLNRSILRRILGLCDASNSPSAISAISPRSRIRISRTRRCKKRIICAERGSRRGPGDLARVLEDLPFNVRRLPSLSNLSTAVCDQFIIELRRSARAWVEKEVHSRVSVPLLHGRLEPSEDGPPTCIPLCRRHYLTRVAHSNQRLALTRLLCGSFYFRGLRSDPDKHAPESLSCRKCGEAPETPGHVFLQCRARETVEARIELRDELRRKYGVWLGFLPTTRKEAEDKMRNLIFDWDTVIPMARFVYRVCKSWRWFGRKLLMMACELAPESDDEWDEDEWSDAENSVGELDRD
uniref:RNase H type-1 domain-containing protein n=1 Tax=Mycena chlorophos TaxID=658473 RepID=A0ABQ0LJ02_MYCCL|nr:predicted protein [Mycena chlorophos]